jgi:hypothetical protein
MSANATIDEEKRTAAKPVVELTDGFHLLIDAFKANGLNTIYG